VGTSSSLHEASTYVQTIEKHHGIKFGCPEEAALRKGFLPIEQFEAAIRALPNCEYKEYLSLVARHARRRY
jgi:glucose-1-phosphate thymidylyltransferase